MPFIASMGIYVISKDVMLSLLREKFPGANDFGSEVIPGATSLGLRVCLVLCISIYRKYICQARIFLCKCGSYDVWVPIIPYSLNYNL